MSAQGSRCWYYQSVILHPRTGVVVVPKCPPGDASLSARLGCRKSAVTRDTGRHFIWRDKCEPPIWPYKGHLFTSLLCHVNLGIEIPKWVLPVFLVFGRLVTVDDVILTNLYTCDILNLLLSALYSQISLLISLMPLNQALLVCSKSQLAKAQVSTEYS